MSDIVQLYSDKSKTKKAYPKTLASETYMSNGGTVESQLAQIENKNIDQDNKLKEVENKNKVQDVYLSGLFNENKDGRLSVEGEGNSLKLEGSKSGLVEVDKVVGNTLVNNFNNKVYNESRFEFMDDGFIKYKTNFQYGDFIQTDISMLKPNTRYTLIVEVRNNTLSGDMVYKLNDNRCVLYFVGSNHSLFKSGVNGIITVKLQSVSDFTGRNWGLYITGNNLTGTVELRCTLFEGDYTNKPIPTQHIEGLQSSFESNLVTQEMINEGLESEENLGKYKVPIKLIGKNLFDFEHFVQYVSNSSIDPALYPINLKSNTKYVFSDKTGLWNACGFFLTLSDGSNNIVNLIDSNNPNTTSVVFNTNNSSQFYLRFYKNNLSKIQQLSSDFQIEEGTVATDCEDYFERTTNVYLNSPLLEGDEIVMKDGELCHYHKGYKEVFDGSDDEKWTSTTQNNRRIYYINIPSSTTFDLPICDKFVAHNEAVCNANILNQVFVGGNPGAKNGNLIFTINGDITLGEFKLHLQANPTKVVYELAEPYYEPIQSEKLLLECANDSTLHIDTVVPVETVKASYTSNVVNMDTIKAATETTECNNLDINDLIIPYCLDLDVQVSEINVVLDTVMPKTENINIKMRGILGGIDMTYQVLKREIMRGIMTYEDCMDKINIFKLDKKLTEVQAEELTELAEIYLK